MEPSTSPKKILILGGTRFLGPAIVEAAKARGHTLTLFNRGKSHPDWFPEIEKLQGDRDPKKDAGLKALEGRQWDAVIDTSGYYPRMVKASAELLAASVKQYIFVSTVSVYAANSTPNADEGAPLGTIEDPTVETMGDQFQNYGPLKALCEQAVGAALPGRATNVRPGYIVGPLDGSDRFTYWPLRVEKGGEVLAPGTPGDPIQVIDVRDLGEWLVLLAEQGTMGVFNAVGLDRELPWGEVLETCKSATKSDATFTWVPADFVQKQEGVGLPIWIPSAGEYAGFHKRSNAAAMRAGLKFRTLEDTVKATLAWFKTQPAERQAALRAGLAPEREAEVLAAWRKESGK